MLFQLGICNVIFLYTFICYYYIKVILDLKHILHWKQPFQIWQNLLQITLWVLIKVNLSQKKHFVHKKKKNTLQRNFLHHHVTCQVPFYFRNREKQCIVPTSTNFKEHTLFFGNNACICSAKVSWQQIQNMCFVNRYHTQVTTICFLMKQLGLFQFVLQSNEPWAFDDPNIAKISKKLKPKCNNPLKKKYIYIISLSGALKLLVM